MTIYIYDTLDSVPVVGPEQGDDAFVHETGKIYTYANLSKNVSFSYDFAGNGSLIVDSLATNQINDSNIFTIDFWSYLTSDDYGSIFSITSNEKRTLITDAASNAIKLIDSSVVYPFSPNDSINASVFFNGVDNLLSFNNIANNISVLNPYTIEFSAFKQSTGDYNILTLSEDNKNIVSIRNNSIINQGTEFTATSNLLKLEDWSDVTLTYDGFDYTYYLDSNKINLTPTNEINYGAIKTKDFSIIKDGAFQFKTIIPLAPTDGVLFSLGTGAEATELKIDNGNLVLTSKGLTASTGVYPKDNAEHIISWDYRIKPQRIRLFIDGQLLASSSSSGSISGLSWADIETSGAVSFSEFTVTASDIQQMEQRVNYETGGAYYFEGLSRPYAIYNSKNIDIRSRLNVEWYMTNFDGPGCDYIKQGGSKRYYFEFTASYDATYNDFYINPYIISKNAPLSLYYANQADRSFFANLFLVRRYQERVRNYDIRNNISKDGINYAAAKFVTYWPQKGRIFSVIIDETTSTFHTFENGNLLRSYDFGPAQMPSTEDFALGFGIYGGSRWNPSNKPYEINGKVYFNRADWILNPIDLYSQISNISEGDYLGTTSPSWADSTNTSKLRYFSQGFNDNHDSSSIGSNYLTLFNANDITGLEYAQNYVSTSGGSIVNYSGSSDLQSVISGMNDGDALVLSPGTYFSSSYQPTIATRNKPSLFFSKNVLVCGSTNNPNDVKIEWTPYSQANSFHPIFYGSRLAQLAFLTFKRNSTLTYNWGVSLFSNTTGSIAKNVIFDFDNGYVSFMYDFYSFPVKNYLIDCIFKNYKNWLNSYNGRYDLLTIDNCKFEKTCSGFDITYHYGNNEFNCEFDSYSLNNLAYKGYITDLKISNVAIDSSSISLNSKRIVDSSTENLIEFYRTGDDILRFDTTGKIVVADKIVRPDFDSFNDPLADSLNTWIYHRLSYHDSALWYYKNGKLVNQFIDSFNDYKINNSEMFIGKKLSFNPLTQNFDDDFASFTVKDFVLKNAIDSHDSYFLIPFQDKISLDSNEILWTAGNNEPPGDDNITVQKTINNVGFSPYTLTGWKQNVIINGAYNSALIQTINNTVGNEYVFNYDSTYIGNFDVYLKFVELDDNDDSIGWYYDLYDQDSMCEVLQKGTNEFIIRKNRNINEEIYSYGSVSITFNSSLLDSFGELLDSNPAQFYVAPETTNIANISPLGMLYSKFAFIVAPISNPIPLRYISDMYEIDSTFNITGYA